mgnify:FL=1
MTMMVRALSAERVLPVKHVPDLVDVASCAEHSSVLLVLREQDTHIYIYVYIERIRQRDVERHRMMMK